jgi:spermidine/putrescine transport system substrate-binding protein
MVTVWLLAACDDSQPPARSGAPPPAGELIFYSWEDDLPRSVIDAFTAEFGIRIVYRSYKTPQEALKNIRAGEVFDLMVIDSPYVQELAREGLIRAIDYRNMPNFKNISANFRDLAHDPGNQYSVTYNWGLTGLLVRGDQEFPPVSSWSDLWDPRYAGRVLVWDVKQAVLGITLKSLGFSINSENPAELEAALERLLVLQRQARVVSYTPEAAVEALAGGRVVLMYGWAGDVLRARARGLDIRFVCPAEQGIQWGDNFVLPAASSRKPTAEMFLNFLLRPEINATIANEQHYATAVEAAYPLIKPEILNDPVIFPPLEEIRRAEAYMPPSPAGKALQDRVWERFAAARGVPESGRP